MSTNQGQASDAPLNFDSLHLIKDVRCLRLSPKCWTSAARAYRAQRRLRFTRTFTSCHQLWTDSGGGLSAVGLWTIPRKFHFPELPRYSETAAVAPSPPKSPQPGESLPAQSRMPLARTRFFYEFRCFADEHLDRKSVV